MVAPDAQAVPAVQRLVRQVDETAPDTLVLLFNPKLVDMQSTGYGLVGRDLRNMVETEFTPAFSLKSYPAGALYRTYPSPWAVWREDAVAADGSGYTLSYSKLRRPSGDDIDEILAYEEEDGGAEGGNPLDGLGKFIKGFQAM